MTCPPDDELRRLIRDEPDDAGVVAHLGDCHNCQERLAALAGGVETWAAVRQLSTADTPPAVASPRPLPQAGGTFAGYTLLRELGRGGMGVVYHARQMRPDRELALKLIRRDRLDALPEGDRRRWVDGFRAEADLVAALGRQENVVTLYEVGEHDGWPYFSMQLVRGGTLADRVTARADGDPHRAAANRESCQRESARLMAAVARGVDVIHRHGLLHRDLKPSNVLLDPTFGPLVSDFGLACRIHTDDTLSAPRVEGTPSYMSPEQARGVARLSTAADVYGLGAILYELLTGRPPFKGGGSLDTLLKVMNDPLIPPRQLTPRLDRDLETVCLKCLEKDPARRYQSAADLAADLDHWLAGRPITARPVGSVERFVRLCRRNPVPTVAAAALLAVAVTAFVLVSLSRNEAVRLANRNGELAESNGDLAIRNLGLAEDARREAKNAKDNEGIAQQEKENARAQKRSAEREAALAVYRQGQAMCEQGDVARGMTALAHALTLAENAEAADLTHLARQNLGVWDAHLTRLERVYPHPTGVAAVAVSPDGKAVVTSDWTDGLRVWDPAEGKPRVAPPKPGAFGPVTSALSFAPDGKTLFAVGHSSVRLLDPASGAEVGKLALKEGGGVLSAAAVRPDGKQVATGGSDGLIRIWDVATQKPVGEPLRLGRWVTALSWAASGTVLACGDDQGAVRLIDLPARKVVRDMAVPGPVAAVAFSPEGLLVAAAGGRTVRVWAAQTGTPARGDLLHTGRVNAVAFSPDGTALATATSDHTARLWPVLSPLPPQTMSHPDEVLAVAFAPDGRTLFTACGRRAGDARRWRLAVGQVGGPTARHAGPVLSVAVSPDGRRIATGSRDQSARLWDGQTGEPVGEPLQARNEVNAVAFSTDSKQLATGSDTGEVLFWDAAAALPELRDAPSFDKGRKLKQQLAVNGGLRDMSTLGSRDDIPFRLEPPAWEPFRGKGRTHTGNDRSTPVNVLTYSPSGVGMAFGCRNGEAFHVQPLKFGLGKLPLSDKPDQWAGIPRMNAPRTDVYALAYSPDGKRVAVGGQAGTVRVWDVTVPINPEKSWEWRAAAVGEAGKHEREVVAVAFSPDGRTVLSGSGDGTARRWDAATGRAVGDPLRHQGPVVAVAFSPDGKMALTAGWDGAVRVWDAATGQPAAPPMLHTGRVLSACFGRAGRLILSGGDDASGRVWDAATGQPVGPPLRHEDRVRVVAFRPDGEAAVTAGDDHTATMWLVPAPLTLPAEQCKRWLETITGLRREADGTVQPLNATAWAAAVAKVADVPAPPAGESEPWHRTAAARAEEQGAWEAATWHLTRLTEPHPKDWQVRLRRGLASLQLGDGQAAGDDFARAAQLAPDQWTAQMHHARWLAGARKWADADAAFSKAINHYPKRSDFDPWSDANGVPSHLWHGRGNVRAAVGKWDDALADLTRAAYGAMPADADFTRFARDIPFSGPQNHAAWADLARVLLARGKAKEYAKVCRDMTIACLPMNHPGTVVSGSFGEQRAYSFGPRLDRQGLTLVAWACGLSAGLKENEFAPLVEVMKRCATAEPKDYPTARTYGAVLLRAGKTKEAIAQLDLARGLRDDPSPAVWLLLAIAHRQDGEADKAADWLKKAKEWDEARKAEKEKQDARDQLPWQERAALDALFAEAEKAVGK